MIFFRSSPSRDRHDGQTAEDRASRHGWYQAAVCGPRKTISVTPRTIDDAEEFTPGEPVVASPCR
jgi:hypothetical protein